jgi:hypothetical protein
LETNPPNAIREKLYKIAGRLVPISGDKHPLFRSMSVQSKKYLKSKNPRDRLQALNIFRIFAATMTTDESITYIMKFLADSDQEIRDQIRNAIIDDQLVPKLMPAFRAIVTETPEVENLLHLGKIPILDTVGILINQKDVVETQEAIVLDKDLFNVNFFRSDRRKKFTNYFRLKEENFAKAMNPLTLGVLAQIELKLKRVVEYDEAALLANSKVSGR